MSPYLGAFYTCRMPDNSSEVTVIYIADMLDQLAKLAEPIGNDYLPCLRRQTGAQPTGPSDSRRPLIDIERRRHGLLSAALISQFAIALR